MPARTYTALAPAAGGAADDAAALTSLARSRQGDTKRLTDILPAGVGPAPDHLDAQLLRDCRETTGIDPVLYDAWRDILPARRTSLAAGTSGDGFWYADLVCYRGGTLTDGQPVRSRGHWNAPGQVELFQTLTGRTLMIVALRTPAGREHAAAVVCEPGHVCAVPRGAWHVTYVLEGPALVFNIYTDTDQDPRGARGAALDPSVKYHRAPPPALAARRKQGGSVQVVATSTLDGMRTERHVQPDTGQCAQWAHRWIPEGGGLVHLYQHGGDDALAALATAICSDPAAGWPLRPLDR